MAKTLAKYADMKNGKNLTLDGRAILMRDSAQKFESSKNNRGQKPTGRDKADDGQRKRDSKYQDKHQSKKNQDEKLE